MTKEDLSREAVRLGFANLGVWSPGGSLHIDFYREWLGRDFHGEMDYLAKHAEMKADIRSLMPECRSVVAVSLNYNQPNERKEGQPRIARYALGRDYHKVIKGKLKALQTALQKSQPTALFKACVDSAPILEREIAHLAGLGWFGKNTCLIDSKRGSWFFLGFLLTSLEIEPDEPAYGSCGNCRRCIKACPTGAIVFEDSRWQLDARNCISYLTIEKKTPIGPELAKALEGWTFGCDICQEVCPFNELRPHQPNRGSLATDSDLLSVKRFPSLVELAQVSLPDWDELTRGSPVRRAGWEGLKRNARLNLQGHADTNLEPNFESAEQVS